MQCVMTMEHGAPVEATAWLPGGSLLATAGGTEIKCAAACSEDLPYICILQHQPWHPCQRGPVTQQLLHCGFSWPSISLGKLSGRLCLQNVQYSIPQTLHLW